MSDTFITVIAIMLAAVLLFVFPILTMADRVDDASNAKVDTITSNFVSEIQMTGKLTLKDYNSFIEELESTGNTYDVNMEVKILDENLGKKSSQTDKDKIGENVYYSIYTTQIKDILESSDNNNQYTFKEGDLIKVTVKNTNLTLSQQLKNWLYTVAGNDTYTVSATESAMVATNGGDLIYTSEKPEDSDKNETENKNELIYVLRKNDSSGEILKSGNNQSHWTNTNIYVELSSKDSYKLDLEYYWKYDYEEKYKKLDSNNLTINEKTIINVYWKHSTLEKYSEIETIDMRIEREKPTIREVIGSTETGNSGTVTINGVVDTGGSGLSGYYISKKPNTPDVNDLKWTYSSVENISPQTVKENGTYYVWTKDNAGNISERYSCTVSGIVPIITEIQLANKMVLKGKDTYFTPQFKLQTEGEISYRSIQFTSDNTNIATVENDGKNMSAKATGINAGNTTIRCTVTNWNGSTCSTDATLKVMEVTYNPNGATIDLPYANGRFTTLNYNDVTISLSETVSKQEYAWSRSNATGPSSWTEFSNGGHAMLTTNDVGKYYLWTRLTDNYGNIITSVSSVYNVRKNKIKVVSDYLREHNLNIYDIIKINTNPSGWTNQNVTVTISLNVPDELKEAVSGLVIQTRRDNNDWSNSDTQIFTENGRIYIRLHDNGTNTETIDVAHNVTNIDKKAPIINSLTPNTTNMTYQNITLTGKAIDVNSGLNAYYFGTSLPQNNWSYISSTTSEITKTYSISENGTYYFCVRDQAGNIATASINISNICKTHTYRKDTITYPTCTNSGLDRYTCTKCGYSYDVTTSALGHSPTNPTCTEPGRCTRCGTITANALGHSSTSPTCTEPGKCTRCGAITANALGHKWKDATCTKPKTCTVCGTTSGTKLGHDWKDATCTEPKTCNRCKTTSGSALGHDWKAATCTEPQTCKRKNCGATKGSAKGHSLTTTTKAATCTTNGSKVTKCKNCSYSVTEVIKATGHSYGGYGTKKAPTCTSEGTAIRYCSKCGGYDTKSIPANGHSYTSNMKKCSKCSNYNVYCRTCGRMMGCGHKN